MIVTVAGEPDMSIRSHRDQPIAGPTADAVNHHVRPEELRVEVCGVTAQQHVHAWPGGQVVQTDPLPLVRYVLVAKAVPRSGPRTDG